MYSPFQQQIKETNNMFTESLLCYFTSTEKHVYAEPLWKQAFLKKAGQESMLILVANSTFKTWLVKYTMVDYKHSILGVLVSSQISKAEDTKVKPNYLSTMALSLSQ